MTLLPHFEYHSPARAPVSPQRVDNNGPFWLANGCCNVTSFSFSPDIHFPFNSTFQLLFLAENLVYHLSWTNKATGVLSEILYLPVTFHNNHTYTPASSEAVYTNLDYRVLVLWCHWSHRILPRVCLCATRLLYRIFPLVSSGSFMLRLSTRLLPNDAQADHHGGRKLTVCVTDIDSQQHFDRYDSCRCP